MVAAFGVPPPAAAAASPKPVTCPNGHPVASFVTPQAGYTCDDCHATMPASFPMEGCRGCNFDLCQRCLAARRVVQHIAGRQCANGHILKPFVTPHANFFCDGCKAKIPMGATTAGCRACDYDLCLPVCCGAATPALPAATIVVPRDPFAFLSGGSGTPASLRDVQAALDAVAGKAGFKCVPVSWEDAQRGTTAGGGLSCWGANISDVRLYEKSGRQLYTLRSQNWNERVGYVASKDVAVVVGNHVPGGSAPALQTLQSYLKQTGTFAGYAGLRTASLFNADVDHIFTIRFQTVFLPVASTESVEFCTEVYNHNTRSDSDPRNLLLLCTAQGTSVQQDGQAAQRLYHHEVDGSGRVHRYWLEAERSSHAVGGAQAETAEEAAAAAARGKSTAIRIGTRAMGTRFNVQMMVQVPLMQSQPPPRRFGAPAAPLWGFRGGRGGGNFEGATRGGGCFGAPRPMTSAMSSAGFSAAPSAAFASQSSSVLDHLFGAECDDIEQRKRYRCDVKVSRPVGTSNAARVSRGSERDTWAGCLRSTPERDRAQHGTITVTLYYTVAGGVPSAADVQLAVEDLNVLYSQCATEKRLVDCHEVTAPLSTAAMILPQPYFPGYTPPPVPSFAGGLAFPQ